MSLQEIIDYNLAKRGAYLDYPFDPVMPVVKVKAPSRDKGRIFAQPFTLKGEPKVTLNCDRDLAEMYRAAYPEAVKRGYHCPPVQQPYFNTISLDGTVPDDEILRMTDHAYNFVTSKLPKAEREGHAS